MSSLLYYSSASGNTQRFINKLGMPAVRLSDSENATPPRVDTPFVLICPTFADGEGRHAVPIAVIRALNSLSFRTQLRGVIATGNRSFGSNFALAGKLISKKCHVPVLYQFELSGTQTDINRVRKGLELFWNQTR